jgi:hypothetical protein
MESRAGAHGGCCLSNMDLSVTRESCINGNKDGTFLWHGKCLVGLGGGGDRHCALSLAPRKCQQI